MSRLNFYTKMLEWYFLGIHHQEKGTHSIRLLGYEVKSPLLILTSPSEQGPDIFSDLEISGAPERDLVTVTMLPAIMMQDRPKLLKNYHLVLVPQNLEAAVPMLERLFTTTIPNLLVLAHLSCVPSERELKETASAGSHEAAHNKAYRNMILALNKRCNTYGTRFAIIENLATLDKKNSVLLERLFSNRA